MSCVPHPGSGSAANQPPELIALGECMVELSGAQPLAQMPASLTLGCGGDSLNALVAAARLGTRCGFISRLGDDPFAAGLQQCWRQQGIGFDHAPLTPGFNGVYFISQLPGGEREFTYRRAGSAASTLAPSDVDEAYVAGARCLLLSGITQAISATAQAATLQAAELARRHGLLLAYDPNYRPALWAQRGGLAAARAALLEVQELVDWFLPSEPADTLLLAGLNSLQRNVAWKCAEQGARLQSAGQASVMVPAQLLAPGQIVDSSGAGDAWNGAFLHGLLRGQTAQAAAGLANAVAAATLAHRGAIPPSHYFPVRAA